MTGTKHPFEKSVKTFNESLQERLDQSLTRISQKSIGNICVALLESRVSDSSNIITRTPIGPNAPYLTMRVQFRNDINIDRVPLFLLATVQPLPPFDTYMEIEKNVELDSSFEFAARGSPTSGKYENSENSRTVAFCGDPYGFVLDSTIQKLYELLLIRMKAFDIDDWAPYFVFTSQTKSSVVKKLTAKILENHPLNTLQLNRYMSFDANIEEGADTFCALFCIRCYQYDCVHHIDKAVKRRLSHFGRNWAIGTKSEPSNDGILNDIMRGNASEHDLALKLCHR